MSASIGTVVFVAVTCYILIPFANFFIAISVSGRPPNRCSTIRLWSVIAMCENRRASSFDQQMWCYVLTVARSTDLYCVWSVFDNASTAARGAWFVKLSRLGSCTRPIGLSYGYLWSFDQSSRSHFRYCATAIVLWDRSLCNNIQSGSFLRRNATFVRCCSAVCLLYTERLKYLIHLIEYPYISLNLFH